MLEFKCGFVCKRLVAPPPRSIGLEAVGIQHLGVNIVSYSGAVLSKGGHSSASVHIFKCHSQMPGLEHAVEVGSERHRIVTIGVLLRAYAAFVGIAVELHPCAQTGVVGVYETISGRSSQIVHRKVAYGRITAVRGERNGIAVRGRLEYRQYGGKFGGLEIFVQRQRFELYPGQLYRRHEVGRPLGAALLGHNGTVDCYFGAYILGHNRRRQQRRTQKCYMSCFHVY